jgi:hypothetical protein
MNDEEGMDKFGVDESAEELTKRAASGCPCCGCSEQRLIKHGSVIICPNCGTEPFEGRK